MEWKFENGVTIGFIDDGSEEFIGCQNPIFFEELPKELVVGEGQEGR